MADIIFILTGFLFYVALTGWALYMGTKEMHHFLKYRLVPPTFYRDGDYVEIIWILVWIAIAGIGLYYTLYFIPFDISFNADFKG